MRERTGGPDGPRLSNALPIWVRLDSVPDRSPRHRGSPPGTRTLRAWGTASISSDGSADV
jgi:hypothetical protein